ncbi:unnamed protein product [Spirodela intermedia]|uniref:Uncharacterized protein n=2 Tax=Spirodela intermedia TaxID=51605 RepID=A0A7I8J2D4_SPIIN|nr:unnamed protein product [Spirodela intermedia]CAA6664297.1 unnamed protein product [Spirodela intermedia]CAA7400861.1 unnamed protein product [Spirodela intermedia]
MSEESLAVPKGSWTTGLFDCFEEPRNSCIACFCPCIIFGQITEIVDKGSTTCLTGGAIYMALRGMGFSCMYSCCYRGKLRQQYSLPGTDCYDCLIHCFCERCSLCQMHRELRNRGFNMEIGWEGNVEKKEPAMTQAPRAGDAMIR